MRYMSIYSAVESHQPPCPDEMQRMGVLVEEMTKAGKLIATGGCFPSSEGARVRIDDGAFTVTDGPFTESKEVVGGFAILECKDKAEAIDLAKQFLKVVGGSGVCEVRLMFTGEAC